jgi:hypothetical protein
MNPFGASASIAKQRETCSDSHLSDGYLLDRYLLDSYLLEGSREDASPSRGEALTRLQLFQNEFFRSNDETDADIVNMPHNLKSLIRPMSKPMLDAIASNLNESFSFEVSLPSMESILVKAKMTPQCANIVMCVASQKLRSMLQRNEKAIKSSLKKSLNKEVNISIENDH